MNFIKKGKKSSYFMGVVLKEFDSKLKVERDDILVIPAFENRYKVILQNYNNSGHNFFNIKNSDVYFHNITINEKNDFFNEENIALFKKHGVAIKKLPTLGENNTYLYSVSAALNMCHASLSKITYTHPKYIKNKDLCAQMSLFIAPDIYKLIANNIDFFNNSIKAFFNVPNHYLLFVSTLMFLKKPGVETSLFHRDDVMAEEDRLYKSAELFANRKQITFNLALTEVDEYTAPLHIFSTAKLDSYRFIPYREVVKYIIRDTDYSVVDILKYLAVCEEGNFQDNTYARVVGCHGINNIYNYYHYNKKAYSVFAENDPGYGFFFDAVSSFHASTPNYNLQNRETISFRIEIAEKINEITPSGFPEEISLIIKFVSALYGIKAQELMYMLDTYDSSKYNCILIADTVNNDTPCIFLKSLDMFYNHPKVQLYLRDQTYANIRWECMKQNFHEILTSQHRENNDICNERGINVCSHSDTLFFLDDLICEAF